VFLEHSSQTESVKAGGNESSQITYPILERPTTKQQQQRLTCWSSREIYRGCAMEK
jgi:hypothetical protein